MNILINRLHGNFKFDNNIEFVNYIKLDKESQKEILNWRNNDNIRCWMHHNMKIKFREHFSFIEKLPNRNDMFYWIVKKNSINIATAYLTKVDFNNKECLFGSYLAPYLIGKGFGVIVHYYIFKLVFESLQFRLLKGEVVNENDRSLNTLLSLGFEKRKIEKDFIKLDMSLKQWLNKKNYIEKRIVILNRLLKG